MSKITKNIWNNDEDIFVIQKKGREISELPIGIYHLNESNSGFYLVKSADKFEMDYKIYGNESTFIDRTVKTYKNTKGNLGILFNGIKGTGKTVTCELLCNALQLPVILVSTAYNLSKFLPDVHQDVIVFVDEFEKIYGKADNILSIMDGALKNEYRKTFIFTTNDLHINENLLQRPGRIRYLKTFGNLSIDVIKEILEDRLFHKELYFETLKFISQLEIITIDIVTSIIDEVNIHKESPTAFRNIFNVKLKKQYVNIIEIDSEGNNKVIKEKTTFTYSEDSIDGSIVGHTLYSNNNNEYFGKIKDVYSDNSLLVSMQEKFKIEKSLVKDENDLKDNNCKIEYTDDNTYHLTKYVNKRIKVEDVPEFNTMFKFAGVF